MDHIRKLNKKTFASLQNKNYRLYFIGQTISFSGTWMQNIAIGLLVLKLTGSGTTLGIVMALQFLPILFIAPFAGIIIDRFFKRNILFITQVMAGILALSLGILIITNMIQMWMVYIFAVCLGIVTAFDNPTRHTFLMEMVGKDLLKNAVALNATMINLARMLGPALAGILVVTVGLGICFIINAISYIAVIITLFMIDTNKLHTIPQASQKKNNFTEGFQYIRSSPVLRTTLIMAFIIGTLTFNFSVLLPLFAEFTFHNGHAYALLTSAMSLGAVLGGLFSAAKGKTSMRRLSFMAFFFGTSMLALAIMPTLATAIFLMIVVGIFSINFTSMANTILQLESVPHMRGRVMSLWTMAFLGSTPIGAPIIGWIGEHMGARWGLAIGGFAALTAAAIGASLVRKILPADSQVARVSGAPTITQSLK